MIQSDVEGCSVIYTEQLGKASEGGDTLVEAKMMKKNQVLKQYEARACKTEGTLRHGHKTWCV